MKRSSVRLYVPSFDGSRGFAAVGPAGGRCRSTAARLVCSSRGHIRSSTADASRVLFTVTYEAGQTGMQHGCSAILQR